jgi:hypothetical protein
MALLASFAVALSCCSNVGTTTNLGLDNVARSNTDLQHWMSKHDSVVGAVLSDTGLVLALADPNIYKPSTLTLPPLPPPAPPIKSPFSSLSEALLSPEMGRACTTLVNTAQHALSIPGVQPQAVADPWYSGLRLALRGSKECIAGVRAGNLTEVKHGVALIEHGADSSHLDRATGAMVEAEQP